jgi:hypothetical protein
MRHVDEGRWQSGRRVIGVSLDEIIFGEDPEADPLAHRLARGSLEHQAVMTRFL